MFQASEFRQTIGSKSTLVPSDHQLDYNDGDTIRFEVPKFIGFIDPRQSFLSMKVSITSPDVRLYFTNSCQSIINNLRIWDLESTVQMENVENYAELVNLFNHYDKNKSITHKRQLLEGADSEAHTLAQSNWFQQYADGETIDASVSVEGNEVQVCLPLKSGILGGDKIFPFALTGGRIEIDTNLATKVLQTYPQGTTHPYANGQILYGGAGNVPAVGGRIATGATADTLTATADGTWDATNANGYAGWKVVAEGGEVNYVISNTAVNPPVLTLSAWQIVPSVGDTFTIEPKSNHILLSNTAEADEKLTLTADTSTNGFMVGQSLNLYYVDTSDVGKTVVMSTTAGAPVLIKTITGRTITFDADWDYPADMKANSGLLDKLFYSVNMAEVSVPRYVMKDIELVLKQVSPPPQYVNQLIKGGTELDIYTYDIYRNNIQKQDKVAQQNIPAYNTRAKCILTLPMANISPSLLHNDLIPVLDELQFYNYYIEGLSQPNKKVPVGIMNDGYYEPIQMWELVKALGSSNLPVKNIKEGPNKFALGRSLGMYGGVHNLADVGDLSLRTEYTGTTAPSYNKLFLNYICHIRRLVITESEKKVIL